MLVVIVGGRGFVGRHLALHLARGGHRVIITTRGHPQDVYATIPQLKDVVEVVSWRLPHQRELPPSLEQLLRGEEYALVNLAGEPIAGPWTRGRKRRIWSSRVDVAKALTHSLQHQPPRVLVQAEGTGYYGDRGEEPVEDNDPPGRGFLAGLSQALEEALTPLERVGTRLAWARLGLVLGPQAPFLKALSPLLNLGLCPRIASRAWMPWVHVEDSARATGHILEKGGSGPYIIASPQAVRVEEFFTTLCKHAGAIISPRIPQRLAALLGGQMARETLLSSCLCRPRRLLEEGFEFKHPSLQGLDWRSVLSKP